LKLLSLFISRTLSHSDRRDKRDTVLCPSHSSLVSYQVNAGGPEAVPAFSLLVQVPMSILSARDHLWALGPNFAFFFLTPLSASRPQPPNETKSFVRKKTLSSFTSQCLQDGYSSHSFLNPSSHILIPRMHFDAPPHEAVIVVPFHQPLTFLSTPPPPKRG